MTKSKVLININKPKITKNYLFFFPFAGGGVGWIRQWCKEMFENTQIIAVQNLGRNYDNQNKEVHISDFLEIYIEDIEPYLGEKYTFFGHSLGGLIAYEVACAINQIKLPLPSGIFLSSIIAPQLIEMRQENLTDLPDQEFVDRIKISNGISEHVLNDKKLLLAYLPILRSDLRLIERYKFPGHPPLNCSIHALLGDNDSLVKRKEVEFWKERTVRDFDIDVFPGDHFYINQHSVEIKNLINDKIKEWSID